MVEYVSMDEASEFDRFVESHPHGNFMQASRWGRVKSDWPWAGLILRDSFGYIKGTMALLRHDLRGFPSCFFYAPRGPVVSDPEDLRMLIEAAADYAVNRNAYLLRIDPAVPEEDGDLLSTVREMGFRIDASDDFSLFQPRLCYLKDLRGMDEKTLEASYRRSTRYNIHKAMRGPLTVRKGDAGDMGAFCAMMERTGRKNGFRPRPRAYYEAVLRGMGNYAELYLAESGGRSAAGAIAVTFGKTCSFFYGCSFEEGDRLHANELLQWHMQKDALEKGCETFDFRGVRGPDDEANPYYGLHTYKKGFGAELRKYAGQLDLPLDPFLYQAIGLLTGRKGGKKIK